MLPGPDSLPLPLWVAQRIDDEAVEYYRGIGCFTPAEDVDPLTVELVQRDDLDPDDPARTHPNPAQVRLTGVRLSPDEARELARLLTAAAVMITETARPRQRPAAPRRNGGRSWNGGYGLAPLRSA